MIPFSKPSFNYKDKKAVIKCLNSGWVTTGKKTFEFENDFKGFVNSKYAIAVSSCTAALHLALLAIGVGDGDEVITTPMTFVSTVNVIEMCGATPRFVDVSEETLLIEHEKLEDVINEKTKAILLVHYAGNPCDLDYVNDIAKKHNIEIIEDAAHAIGSRYKNRMIGDSDNLVCFSFYPTKNMTTCEGGMITTNSDKYIEKLKKMRLHGLSLDAWKRYTNKGNWKYDVDVLGYKYTMPDIFASIGIIQLKRVADFNNEREKISKYYKKKLSRCQAIKMLECVPGTTSSFFMFVVRVDSNIRDAIIEKLLEKKIGTSVLFMPVHEFSYYRYKYNIGTDELGNCERIAKEIICLPIYPGLKRRKQRYVVKELVKLLDDKGET